ncbi:PucR family transcriptional regulator [Streptococcus ovuberis]|uniref:PucR family transcriptional regulator n=1 Tax=Streptococcus ovuberis TaxID=1936207 RepID=UPI0031B57E14
MSDFHYLFPEAKRLGYPPTDGALAIPLEDGQWLSFNPDLLSPREQYLIQAFQQSKSSTDSLTPWIAYLVYGEGQAPQSANNLQWLHVHLHNPPKDLIQECQKSLAAFFPNLMSSFSLDTENFCLVLNQETYFNVEDLLKETLPSLEFDFGMKISVAIGQFWPNYLEDSWPNLFQLEQRLFQYLLRVAKQDQVTTFSQLLLSNQKQKETAKLYQFLSRLITHHEDLPETILCLWKTQAVLTKAAQNLYIHRNTLQYRLDRFQEQTGLSLRNMDDLAVCYLALLNP